MSRESRAIADGFTAVALAGFPLVGPGDDLVALIGGRLAACGEVLRDGDVVAVSQKIVSKAEGRRVALRDVVPGEEARRLAAVTGKDPRLVELILSQSERVVRAVAGVLIVRHRLGHVMANAGIDFSNVEPGGEGEGDETALLLPADPDASAERLRAGLERAHDRRLAVVVVDSFGRPWRMGTTGVAIGVAGMPALVDLRGRADLFGRLLKVTETAVADQVAAAASLLMGEAAEGRPVVVLSGLGWDAQPGAAAALPRPVDRDLFL